MCEIRFSLSSKDGKLEQMMNSVSTGVRTEVVKEALRYFLSHVRDEKVESMYIDSSDLSKFRSSSKAPLFTMDDVMRMMEYRPTQPPITTIIQPQHTVEESANKSIDTNTFVEPNIEFDCDNTEVLVNEDMLDMDF